MATYKEIDAEFRRRHGQSVKTCWIADVKSSMGFPMRSAHNRRSASQREVPCPDHLRSKLEAVIRHLHSAPSPRRGAGL